MCYFGHFKLTNKPTTSATNTKKAVNRIRLRTPRESPLRRRRFTTHSEKFAAELTEGDSYLHKQRAEMDSTESETTDESPEEPSQEPDSSEKPTHIRFLVPKALAGYVIGKGGSTITQFQDHSGAQILLSRNQEYFPGTTCRIVVMSGTTVQVLTAFQLVLAKLHCQLQAEDGSDVELRRTRVVIPHSSCGSIIGKGGATIRFFIENSKAGIKISPLDFELSDRLLTLSGTMEEQMRAIALILTKLTEEDDYSQQMHSPNSYRKDLGLRNILHAWKSVKSRRSLGSKQNHKEDSYNSVTIGVSDEHIGVVIGRKGSHIMEISESSGARIKISGRGGFLPGTTDRKVTISGFQASIDLAVSIIERKVDKASKRRAKDETDMDTD
ncbi:hypothetical protein HID58_068574 [Brassica napus]|uniref:K Homology domain-containing protein n=2 Tax=Brassica TaxID=3705 RepID=A0ABQ7ZLQ7_BRANA|nr:hypothetical protein HID58_068574 [Brassica napus]VDD46865.1 unnamed protein product [Brassica oleracea]